MAKNTEGKISLKLMVDTEKNKVVFAEADRHFVDNLFSFLTLPLGTIVRLLGEESRVASIWSLTNLYKGVDWLDSKYFPTEECRMMLLWPMNAPGHLCQKLKLTLDDTEPIKYFCCCNSVTPHLGLFKRALCSCRQKQPYEELEVHDYKSAETGPYSGVFIKSETTFITTNDLQVFPGTYDSICLLLNNHGISQISRLKAMNLEIGLKELVQLLELSLFSKSPLTDMFLRVDKLHVPRHFPASNHVGNVSDTLPDRQQISVKLVCRKSDHKVLFAEAKEDFIDFQFSILTLPLGAVVELFGADSSLTCIDNLYKSVNDLDAERLLGSDFQKAILLSPKLPPTYKCKNQPLDVHEMHTNFAIHHHGYGIKHLARGENCPCGLRTKEKLEAVWLDPKAQAMRTTGSNGYVQEPANFMVTDDLIVMPLSPTSTIGLLNHIVVEYSDLIRHEVSVGREEALYLLKASLSSTSALTTDLNLKSRSQSKQEK